MTTLNPLQGSSEPVADSFFAGAGAGCARKQQHRLHLLVLPQGKAQGRTRRDFLAPCSAVHHTTW